MNQLRWLYSEWISMLRSPKSVVTLIGILLIPAIYSGGYLWAFWDPYAHVERLPVAVVNEDRPVMYQGRNYSIGEDLVEELKKDKGFQWHFVDRKQAEAGFKSNAYYFEILIPEDFSHRATTLMEQQPTPLELTIRLNEGLNYTVGKIGQTGVEEIRRNLAENLTKNYSEVLFTNLGKLDEGLEKAAEGSTELNKGIQEAAAGAEQLQAAVRDGQPGVKKLDQGAAQLNQAAEQVNAGVSQLAAGAAKLSGGLDSLGAGLSALQQGSTSLSQGVRQVDAGGKQLDQALASWLNAHPEVTQDAGIVQMAELSKKLSGALTELLGASDQLAAGLTEAGKNQPVLADGAKQLTQKLTDLDIGTTALSRGATDLASGVHQTAVGWNSLLTHVTELTNGERKLADGSAKLSQSLGEGASHLGEIHASTELYEMLANPVRLKEEFVHALPNYGTGMAPFFVSVSLFVGALLFSTIFPMKELRTPAPSGWIWFMSKYGVLCFVSVGQTAMATWVLITVVGLEPLNIWSFWLFGLYSSLVFMAIIQLLVTAGNNVGRFIGVVLLVLQLTATSGTYPVELVPQVLQDIHRFLPVSYTVEGFRSLISTGDYGLVRASMQALLLFWVPCLLLTLLLLTRIHARGYKNQAVE